MNADLSAKVEKLKMDNEELRLEAESLDKYRSKWEQSISFLKEAESQSEYIKQLEAEVSELKSKLAKKDKEIEENELSKDDEITTYREEIDALQMKNIELVKNESLVKMYKKKLEGLKDIKQAKMALEFDLDNLKGELEQSRLANSQNKDQKKTIDFFKTEIESYKKKVIDFEDALKGKDNEIIKIKNALSKTERESKVKDQKIISLEAQVEELLDKSDEGVDEYKEKIKQLENQVNILKKQNGGEVNNERLIMLEESHYEKESELAKNWEKIDQLQKINSHLEEELDNLRNELSTINDGSGGNGEVHRASVEGIKRNQIERDLRKCTQDKIKLDTDLEKAKDYIKDLEVIRKDRDLIRDQMQELYNQKNELQDKLYSVKDEKLSVLSKLNEAKQEVKSLQREVKNQVREVDYLLKKEEVYSKEIDNLKSNQNSGGQDNTVLSTEILQKESEVLKLTLKLKEKDEDLEKFKEMYEESKEKIEKINQDHKERFLLEKKNNRSMNELMIKKMKDYKIQFQKEEKYLVN
jgi:chromosome segregation ATPase